MIRFATLSLLMLPLATTASARELKPAAIEASSTLPGDKGVSYAARNAIDGRQSTVWVEGDTGGSGLGTWLQINLDGPQEVSGIQLWNGNWYTYDFWTRHNRVKELEVTFSDDTKQTFTLTDEMVPEMIRFPSPKNTEFIKLKIRGIYRGSTFNDTVISEVKVYERGASPELTVTAWSDSSHLPSDGDGTYEPSNTADNILDSMWCEGAEGDGTGEWMSFEFGQTREVGALRIVNGNAYGLPYWMKSNRILTAELAFSDGSTQTIDLKNVMMEQTIPVKPVSTQSVRLTVKSVYRGKEAETDPAYDCVCVSEASFLPGAGG